ncbi:MFS transporter [Agromyces mediolanus]|uniref:MFS transporter n=1 Tax=Agromyces mediolanus TaxID=41986 RepID=UPI0038370940
MAERTTARMTLVLVCAGLATFADLYAIQGVLPLVAAEFGVDAATAGLTVSAATLGLGLAVLPWVAIGERIGRVRAMRIAVLGAAALSLLSAAAPTIESLLVARLLCGALLAAVPVLAIAYVHEQLGGTAAARAVAAYVAGTTLGGASGRLLAGVIADPLGWRTALVLVAMLSAAAAVTFSLLARGGARTGLARPGLVRGVRTALANPGLSTIALQTFLLIGVFVGMYSYLTFRLQEEPYSFSPATIALLTLCYLVGTVTARLSAGFVARLGYRRTVVLGVAGMAAGLGLTCFEPILAVVAGLAVFTGAWFLTHAAASAETGARAPADYRAHASAVYTIAFYLGSAVGGWALGLLFHAGGWAGFALGGGALVAVAGVIALASGPRREPSAAAA